MVSQGAEDDGAAGLGHGVVGQAARTSKMTASASRRGIRHRLCVWDESTGDKTAWGRKANRSSRFQWMRGSMGFSGYPASSRSHAGRLCSVAAPPHD